MEKKEKGWNGLRNGVPCLFVAPAMVLLVIFVFYPLVNLIYLSFFDYNLIGRRNLSDLRITECCFLWKTDFLEALQNTAVYTVTVVFFCMLLAVLFAMWLEKDSALNRFLQRSMFTPYLISLVSCAYIWSGCTMWTAEF